MQQCDIRAFTALCDVTFASRCTVISISSRSVWFTPVELLMFTLQHSVNEWQKYQVCTTLIKFFRLLLWFDKNGTGRQCLQYYVWAWHKKNPLQELRVGTLHDVWLKNIWQLKRGQKLLKCQEKPYSVHKMQENAWRLAAPSPRTHPLLSLLRASPVLAP